jgi:hypothetical protein
MAEQDAARTPREPGGGPPVLRTDLRQNSLGLVGVTMQAITHIAPAIAGAALGESEEEYERVVGGPT